MPERTTMLVLLLAGVVGATALALRWARRRLQPPPTGATGAEPPMPPATHTTEARKDFADVADKFSGLYEPLQGACVARPDSEECRTVLSEWEVRVNHVGGAALRHEWQSAVREATGSDELGDAEAVDSHSAVALGTKWLDLLRSWGVERDERTTFVFGEGDQGRYRVSGAPRPDGTVEVELPCWTYEGVVLERGIARVSVETD